MADTDAQPTLTPAEDNPWYLLATLHGVPTKNDKKRQAENRVAWNRYYASRWTDEDRERLKGRVAAEELRPLDDQELVEIRQKFANRAEGRQIGLPDPAIMVNFTLCCFQDDVSFQHYVFAIALFNKAIFAGEAYFNSATFAGHAFFGNARFDGYADFTSTTFAWGNEFSGATFDGEAEFSGATFDSNANFKRANFYHVARFRDATFAGFAGFDIATFHGEAIFNRTTFARNADFRSAIFAGVADFTSTTFPGDTYFSSATFCEKVIFTNADMKAPTDFEGCRFEKYPPLFPGAKLHEGTVWRGVSWPLPPKNPKDVGLFTDAYEHLRREMDRLKKHEDERIFFAKELQCRRVTAGRLGGLSTAVYGALCHYGESYLRPLGWLLAVILVGAVQFWPVLGWDFLVSLGVSTANTLVPPGLRRELVDPSELSGLSGWFRLLTGIQMVMGLVLLFLIGLGLRNRFRMK